MNFKTFVKELTGQRVEGELITTIFISLIASFATLALLYAVRLRFITGFVDKYAFFLFFAVLSYAVLLPVVRHVQSYADWLCMPGMMIGMTSGMIAGFLPGFYVASTNGMFIGSVVGMVLGIMLGIWNGKCCGVMGIMEGVMAGFMGGLMGAMTAFMLLNDHLKAMAVIVFVVSAALLVMLHYMVFLETREHERVRKDSHMWVVVASVILTAVTTWIIVLGPRSGLFS